MPGSRSYPFSRRPPHCPSQACDSHTNPGTWRFKKKGFYWRAAAPHRIQRYVCRTCGRNFSSQTFSVTYWMRHPELLRPVFFRILACSAQRQIAPELDVGHTTIQRCVERLGRHCLLLLEKLRPRCPREPCALDGFRSLESGHYWPFDLNLLVGQSHYIYGFNEAELRRSGTMRPRQRHKRERLEARYGRPAPQATRRAVTELVARVVPAGGELVIHSDEHRAYPPALRDVVGRRIRHVTTSSREPRTTSNPLFPINLADLLLRHTGANHKRETIAFSKRRQNACYRAAILAVWRNFIKRSSERRAHPPPGVKLGVISRRWSVDDVLRTRLFPWRQRLTDWLTRCYFGRIPTRAIPRCRPHERTYAV